MVYCGNCGTANEDGSLFCIECGNKIEAPAGIVCSNCGQALSSEDKFCLQCGTPVTSSAPVSTVAPEASVIPELFATPMVETPVVETPVVEAPVVSAPAPVKTYVKLTNVQTGAVYESVLEEQVTIGKRNCSITISDDKAISGTHCQIYTYENSFVLADMGSTNGTKLNDYKIDGPVFIEPESILAIGRQKFIVTFENK